MEAYPSSRNPTIVANVSLGARCPNETVHRRCIYANGARV